MSLTSFTLSLLTFTSLCCSSLAAPAIQPTISSIQLIASSITAPAIQPTLSSIQSIAPATETLFPIPGSPPLPAPISFADMATLDLQPPNRAISVFSLNSSSSIIPSPLSSSPTTNQLEILYCITAFSVGGSGTEGFLINYHDATVSRTESVAFRTSGPNLYLVYQLLKPHTNPSAFYEDIDIFGSSKGLNVGYRPTGKSLNVAGWTPEVVYDGGHQFERVQEACGRAFEGLKPDGRTGSFYQRFGGGVVPSLLSEGAVAFNQTGGLGGLGLVETS